VASNDAEFASQVRRLAGFLLDCFLFVLTLGVGWVIWYLILARSGQSPAKRLLATRVIRDDGAAAGLGRLLIRDVVVRGIALGTVYEVLMAVLGRGIGWPSITLVFTLSALWCVWDADRECVWDKILGTRVVNARCR